VPGRAGLAFLSRRDLMKKVILVVLVVGLAVGGGFRQAYAQDKKIEFSLNLGIMTNLGSGDSFTGAALALSPQLDIHVTKGFMISPEAMVVTDFEFSGALVFPGVILNYTGKGFFAGAGVVTLALIGGGEAGVAGILPKFNLGYRGKRINFTAYLITAFQQMFSENLAGATIGYRF
jgi:hypothetical protein